MPIFDTTNQLVSHHLAGSPYGFSATRIDTLGAAEYTLVVIAADVSGSVSGFRQEIEDCVKRVVRACRLSPRVDNLLLRFVTFDSRMDEVHGFRPLFDCHEASYDKSIRSGGMTALYDAAHNCIEAATAYGRDLTEQDFDVNMIAFVITDGGDNASTLTKRSVGEALARAVTSESVESVVSVLVGVNVADAALSAYLKDFKDEAGFTQYVEIERANEKTLARLADFVSRSISAQSQALGTGGATRSLSF